VYFNDVSRGKLVFQVKHKDAVKKDPVIGELVLEASQALARKTGDDWYKLYNCSTGRIRMAIQFLPVKWATMSKFAQDDVIASFGSGAPGEAGKEGTSQVASTKDVIESAEMAKFGLVWVGTHSGEVPPNAVEAGMDGVKSFSPLYIGRVNTGSAVLIGKCGGTIAGCNYGLNGKEYLAKDYEILCASNAETAKRLRWVQVTSMNETFAHRMVSGDCVDAVGNRLVIARARFRNGTHPGYAGLELAGTFLPAPLWFFDANEQRMQLRLGRKGQS